MRKMIWSLVNNEEGPSAIEYGLLAVGIAVAIVSVLAALGSNLDTTFSHVSGAFK